MITVTLLPLTGAAMLALVPEPPPQRDGRLQGLHMLGVKVQLICWADAPPDELGDIHVDGEGFNLHWPALDVDLYVPGLVAGVFGTVDWTKRALARAGHQPDQEAEQRKEDDCLDHRWDQPFNELMSSTAMVPRLRK